MCYIDVVCVISYSLKADADVIVEKIDNFPELSTRHFSLLPFFLSFISSFTHLFIYLLIAHSFFVSYLHLQPLLLVLLTGHHCTQPLHARLNAAGSVRASLYFYNNKEDVDFFILKLKETIAMFASMDTSPF